MKKIFVITLLMICSSQLFAQEAKQQVNKSKSNVKNNFAVEGDSQTQSGREKLKATIHIDIDESGNDLVFIPTNPKPTVLTLDMQSQTFRAAGKVKGKITTGGDIGNRMHKPYFITSELDKKLKRTTDENGDIDVSDLEAGNYELKINGITDGIKFSVSEDHRVYTAGR